MPACSSCTCWNCPVYPHSPKTPSSAIFLTCIDSLISSHVYEIIKTIYSTQTGESDDTARISVIQNTLGQLRLANIATLDAITTHFTRLIDLTSADDAYVASLATTLAPCILRPRTESGLTLHERYSYRLVRDLLAHKDAIFGELKRASAMSSSVGSQPTRPRRVSGNERDRRANMEARTQAIMSSRSRASSPQPHPSRAHRRERSTGGVAATRFPVQASPPIVPERKTVRQSLEVPGSAGGSQDATDEDAKVPEPAPSTRDLAEPSPSADGHAEESPSADAPADKRSSLGRPVGGSGKVQRRVPAINSARQSLTKRDSLNGHMTDEVESPQQSRPVGVTLVDKPVDD